MDWWRHENACNPGIRVTFWKMRDERGSRPLPILLDLLIFAEAACRLLADLTALYTLASKGKLKVLTVGRGRPRRLLISPEPPGNPTAVDPHQQSAGHRKARRKSSNLRRSKQHGRARGASIDRPAVIKRRYGARRRELATGGEGPSARGVQNELKHIGGCVRSLTRSLEGNAQAEQRGSRKMLALTGILVAATVVSAAMAVVAWVTR